MDDTQARRRHLLTIAGQAIAGDMWQRALARQLGPLHPQPRDTLDERLMRRWAAGERDIPDWVGPALDRLCAEEQRLFAALHAELEEGW